MGEDSKGWAQVQHGSAPWGHTPGWLASVSYDTVPFK